jgi:hypothetical protein
MPTIPRATRMVLFKHGVAYVERSGPAEGSFELSFKRDEMNDVLKSLAVWVARGDAKVGALAFEKPEDPEKALEERRLSHPWERTLAGVLSATRGRRVAVQVEGASHEGEVVGAEVTKGPHGEERRSLALRSAEDVVEMVDLAQVRSLRLLEPSSRADLAFFLDRRRAATSGESRTVRVSITGRAEDLRVSYVIPAPTWRVSYRIARGKDSTVLMAWGIVHNPADEDLDDIDLTLTTGQPVSFTIDLYNPLNVHRAVVEESSRAVAAGPTRFERARAIDAGRNAPVAGGPAAPPPPASMTRARAPAPAREPAAFGMAEATVAKAEAEATYEERGELFEYRVAQRVSLARGSSAMVPLIGTQIDAGKERIWREGSPAAPDLVLSFRNTTGAVLEEGPAVVYDEDVYAGEAMVPYSPRGAEVKLAFAKDLAVRCKRTSVHKTITTGVRLSQGFLAQEQRREEHHELWAESDHDDAVDVFFELPKVTGRSLAAEHTKPVEETSSFRRFLVTVPPHGKATARVVEQWHESQHFEYARLTSASLAWWLENRFLDRATFDALSDVVAAQSQAQELDARRARVEEEQTSAYTKQTKIADQLKVLKEGGPEGELRLRYVRELQEEQDKVNACEKEIRALRDGAESARRRGEETLRRLSR